MSGKSFPSTRGQTGTVAHCNRQSKDNQAEEERMRQVYTTGQTAKLLRVATRTVAKWFDQGRLRGYRIQGNGDRRIPRESLIHFMTVHGFAIPAELQDKPQQEDYTMTLNDYANDRKDVVLFWTSVGCSTGDYTTLGYPDLDFAERRGLLELSGTVDEADDWHWDGKGSPTDDQVNSITKLHAYADTSRWAAIVEEYESIT